MTANLEKPVVATGLEKISFHSNPKERQCQITLRLSHYCTISQTSKIMLKILQASLQQYTNHELPDVQAIFRAVFKLHSAEEPEIKLPTSVGSPKKQESSRKTSSSALMTMSKPLIVYITTNCGKF